MISNELGLRVEGTASPVLYVKDSKNMKEVPSESVDLVITSPPYWNIVDYGNDQQIGYNQSINKYIESLTKVWIECYRVLRPGGRICINIGDQYVRASKQQPYQIIPIHALMINDLITNLNILEKPILYLGSIIWKKVSNTKTSGGGVFMGSYPYPRNGMVTYNFEYIAIFKKPGKSNIPTDQDLKERSRFTKDEWSEYFSGIWNFSGTSEKGHPAMFPDELPYRLIRMFSFEEETILDPFAGSGTTLKVAQDMNRTSIGYEIGWKNSETEYTWQEIVQNKVPGIKIID
jgi:modification methylase